MAIDVAELVYSLEQQYMANLDAIAALPAFDVSDQGRSVNATGARAALTARQAEIEKTLARLGFPVGGGLGAPFVVRTRVRG